MKLWFMASLTDIGLANELYSPVLEIHQEREREEKSVKNCTINLKNRSLAKWVCQIWISWTLKVSWEVECEDENVF